MTTRSKIVRAVVAALILAHLIAASSFAFASPPIRFTEPVTCQAEGARPIDLSPGRYLPEEVYQEGEEGLKVLQNDVTRLTAENEALLAYEEPVNWWLLSAAAAAGILLGAYATSKL